MGSEGEAGGQPGTGRTFVPAGLRVLCGLDLPPSCGTFPLQTRMLVAARWGRSWSRPGAHGALCRGGSSPGHCWGLWGDSESTPPPGLRAYREDRTRA